MYIYIRPSPGCVCTCVGLWAACGDIYFQTSFLWNSSHHRMLLLSSPRSSLSMISRTRNWWPKWPVSAPVVSGHGRTVDNWSTALEQGHRCQGRRRRGADRGHKLQSYKTLMGFVWGGHRPRVLVSIFPSLPCAVTVFRRWLKIWDWNLRWYLPSLVWLCLDAVPLAVWLHTAVRGVVCIICIMAAAECSANTYETRDFRKGLHFANWRTGEYWGVCACAIVYIITIHRLSPHHTTLVPTNSITRPMVVTWHNI